MAVEELVLVGDLGGEGLGVVCLLEAEASAEGAGVLDLDVGGNGAISELAALLNLEGDIAGSLGLEGELGSAEACWYCV